MLSSASTATGYRLRRAHFQSRTVAHLTSARDSDLLGHRGHFIGYRLSAEPLSYSPSSIGRLHSADLGPCSRAAPGSLVIQLHTVAEIVSSRASDQFGHPTHSIGYLWAKFGREMVRLTSEVSAHNHRPASFSLARPLTLEIISSQSCPPLKLSWSENTVGA